MANWKTLTPIKQFLSQPKVFPVRLRYKNERSKGSADEGLAITHAIFRRGSQYHTKFGVPKIEVTPLYCSKFYPRVRHDTVA